MVDDGPRLVSSREEVVAFLTRAKGLVTIGHWQLLPRNTGTLTVLELTMDDVRDVLLALAVSDYGRGPEPDRDPLRPGDVWLFVCSLPGSAVVELYVKLKIPPGSGYLIVLSFHPPERHIVRPYKSGTVDDGGGYQLKNYCYECYAEREVRRVTRELEMPVRGDLISVTQQVDECMECGSRVPTPEMEATLLEAAYAEYRRRHAVPGPNEIREIRSRYGLSQRSLARLLNWGLITVHRYERGALPDASHAAVIRSLRDPKFVRRLLNDATCGLTDAERADLRAALEVQQAQDRTPTAAESLEDLLTEPEPNEWTGYRRPSPERLVNMAAYFADHVKGDLFRVRLMKLLFYADFCHFAREAVSISGFPYAALPMGPVPDRYQVFLTWAELSGHAKTEIVNTGFGPGVVSVAWRKYSGMFSNSELRTLDAVIHTLGRKTGSQLTELSHDEPAWRETPIGKQIPYSYANRLAAGSAIVGLDA